MNICWGKPAVANEKTGTPFRVPIDLSSSGLLIVLNRRAGLDPVLLTVLVLGDIGVAHAGQTHVCEEGGRGARVQITSAGCDLLKRMRPVYGAAITEISHSTSTRPSSNSW